MKARTFDVEITMHNRAGDERRFELRLPIDDGPDAEDEARELAEVIADQITAHYALRWDRGDNEITVRRHVELSKAETARAIANYERYHLPAHKEVLPLAGAVTEEDTRD